MANNRKIRTELYKKNPFCYYCYCRTILIDFRTIPKGTATPKKAATIEHLWDKFNVNRTSNKIKYSGPLVIACSNCNHTRGYLALELPENKYEALKRDANGRRGKEYHNLFNDINWFDRF